MPIKVQLERQSIAQAEKADTSSLFVLNKSNPRGNVNFVVVDSGQQKISVQVPVTFIPVDLSVFSERSDVLRNPHFRRLIARGYLHIVSSDSAEKFMEDPRARKEHDRVFDVLTDEHEMDFQAPVEQSVNASPPESGTEVSTFVQNILLRVAQEDEEDLILDLERKLDTLNKNDVQYLMDNSSSAKIKSWCVDALEVIE